MSARSASRPASARVRPAAGLAALLLLFAAPLAHAVPHACAQPRITITQCANVSVGGTSTCTMTETATFDQNCLGASAWRIDSAANNIFTNTAGSAYSINMNPAVSTCLAIPKTFGTIGYPSIRGYYYPMAYPASCTYQIIFHPTSSGTFSAEATTSYVWSNTVAAPASCTQQQTVTCRRSDGTTAPDTFCNAATKPATSQSCHSAELGC